jgi:hypothetical protein
MNLYSPFDRRWYERQRNSYPSRQRGRRCFRDRYVYLIGQVDRLLVNNVQVYDAEKILGVRPQRCRERRSSATLGAGGRYHCLPGWCYEDYPRGTLCRFRRCWLGKIDHRIRPRSSGQLPAHRAFGIAAGERTQVLFSGGTASPRNFKGIGYDGQPARLHRDFATICAQADGKRSANTRSRMDSRRILSPLGAVAGGWLRIRQ